MIFKTDGGHGTAAGAGPVPGADPAQEWATQKREGKHSVRTCDVFCAVIDNYGDAGVAWRLARSLAAENGWQVRLVIDNLERLAAIVPEIGQLSRTPGTVDAITVAGWELAMDGAPADVVIELFSCFLPAAYEAAIAQAHDDPARRSPVVLALDYLTAEDYAEEGNGLPSPHPRYGYPKTFLFPGFGPRSCGLLREAGLEERLAAWKADPGNRRRLFARLGADAGQPFTLYFFAYPQVAISDLARALAQDPRPLQILAPPGEAGDELERLLARHGDRNHLRLVRVPMVAQSGFDEVLASCDAALVRGEDSTLRCQLAGVPLIWMLYPQTDDNQLVKFRAFARHYAPHLPDDDARQAWLELNEFINSNDVGQDRNAAALWAHWRDRLAAMQAGAISWQKSLFARTSLTQRLTQTVLERLKYRA